MAKSKSHTIVPYIAAWAGHTQSSLWLVMVVQIDSVHGLMSRERLRIRPYTCDIRKSMRFPNVLRYCVQIMLTLWQKLLLIAAPLRVDSPEETLARTFLHGNQAHKIRMIPRLDLVHQASLSHRIFRPARYEYSANCESLLVTLSKEGHSAGEP